MNSKGLGTSSNYGLKRSYPFTDSHPSSPPERSLRFDELLGKFGTGPHALNEHELNELVCECMFHGDVEALRRILKARPLHTLDISRPVDERAWWTLLGALPEPCAIKALKLGDQQFTSATAALFLEAAGRMGNLESLRVHSCNWNVEPGELTCSPLPNLRELHIENTGNPLPLVGEIFKASQVSRFYFASNPGMAEEDHASLAILLIAQCEAKLRDLTLRDLQARDQTLEALFEHYIAFLKEETTMLTYLDLSGNKLSSRTCTGLADALEDMTLHGLKLAGCWPESVFFPDCRGLARLIGLTSLVELGLSHNDFPWSHESIFKEIVWCKKLQHLDLAGSIVRESDLRVLAYGLEPKSLCLPRMPDRLYELFFNAASKSLLFLRADEIENLRAQMPEEFSRLYPKYLDLRARVDDNWRKWKGAVHLVEEGMKVFLSGLGGVDPTAVPPDIARRAAAVAINMNGAQTESLSLLNKSARQKVSAPETSFPVDKN